MTYPNPAYAYAFQFRMPAGFPGTISRMNVARTRALVMTSTAGDIPTLYGLGVVEDATTGQMRLPTTTDTVISGLLVRPMPGLSQAPSTIGNDLIGAGSPLPGIPQDMLEAGYMSVQLYGAAAATPRAPVYVWAAASAGSHIQGGLEAAATSGSTIQLGGSDCYFIGAADANGITEVHIRY
jgi:hypothetical protein